MKDIPLFDLDADGRWRLAHDDLQWVLQKRRGKPNAKASGFVGVSFIATKKGIILWSVIREKGIVPSAEAINRLEELPGTFKEFSADRARADRKPASQTVVRDAGQGKGG